MGVQLFSYDVLYTGKQNCVHIHKTYPCVSNIIFLSKLDAAVGISHEWQINFIDASLLFGYNYCSRLYNQAYITPISDF